MRISITFDTTDDLQAIHLARLLLDLQHLTVMVTALALLEEPAQAGMLPIEVAFDAPDDREDSFWKYSSLIEHRDSPLGPLTAIVDKIHKESPMTIELLLKLPKAIVSAIKNNSQTIYKRIFFHEEERTRLFLENELRREDLRKKRLENLSSAFKLAKTIPDPVLRKQFEQNLVASVRPFLDEHPPVKSLDIKNE